MNDEAGSNSVNEEVANEAAGILHNENHSLPYLALLTGLSVNYVQHPS